MATLPQSIRPLICTLGFAACLLSSAIAQAPGPPVQQSPAAAVQQPSAPPPPQTTGPSIVRVELAGPLKIDMGSGPPSWTYWIPVVGPLISGALAFLGAWLGLSIAQRSTARTIDSAQRINEASIWQKANESELKDLQNKLEGFYGPFMLMLKTNRLMAQDLRDRLGQEYRLLLRVFDRAWLEALSPGDRKIVEEVCTKADQLEKFIASHVGVVDDKIAPYLARASAHFRILHLAHAGHLGTDPTPFTRYVFPKELDGVLELEVARLRRRCERLRTNPGSPPELAEPLVIPRDLELQAWPDPPRPHVTNPPRPHAKRV
jgi:hypothetical protein